MKIRISFSAVAFLFLLASSFLCGCKNEKVVDVGMERSEAIYFLGTPDETQTVHGKKVDIYHIKQRMGSWTRTVYYDKNDKIEDITTSTP